MENENLTPEQLKKAAYFENTPRHYSSGKNRYSQFKQTGQILDDLLTMPEFGKIKKYIGLNKLFKTILPPAIVKMICFAYYRKQKLTIQVMHPVGQQELNYRKKDIISICKKLSDFSDILEVSVFRQDKINKFSKEFNEEYFNVFSPHIKAKREKAFQLDKMNFFEERSVGIFQAETKNERFKKKYSDIKKAIKANRESDELRDDNEE